MLGDAFILDGSKYRGPLRFGNIKTEFLGFQDNAVEPALLSQNNLPPCADQVGRKGFNCLGDVKLAGDGAAFAHEKVLADGRLPRFERVSAGPLNKLRDAANPGKVKGDRNVVKTTEGESDFAKVGIACAFAHAVDGPLDPGGACANSGDGARSGHTKIVVAVKMDGNAGTNPLADLANEVLDSFRTASTDCIDNDDFGSARFKRSKIDFFQKFGVGAEPGLEHELDGFGVVSGDTGKSCLDATNAESVELVGNFQLLLRR